MHKKTLISIIIPVYNESNYIKKCLEGVLKFEKPKNVEFEILIGDGNSSDNTIEIVDEFKFQNNNIVVFDNPNRYQSYAMNIGIDLSKGIYILRLDAHAEYPKNYLKLCYESSVKNNSDNTGGIIITKPGSDLFSAKIVQALTTHKFGVGDSSFRTEEVEGETDTVPFGFFKKEIFNRIGMFDERLIRCQDYEFNRRITSSKGKIWINSKIKAVYYNQSTIFNFLKKQFNIEAPFNPYLWYLAPYAFSLRHAITGFFSVGFIIGLFLVLFDFKLKILFVGVMILYTLLAFLSSIQQSIRYSNFKLFFFLPLSFFLFHIFHGFGILKGIILLILNKSPVQKRNEPWFNAGRFYGLKK